jgi:hypothetical protein
VSTPDETDVDLVVDGKKYTERYEKVTASLE